MASLSCMMSQTRLVSHYTFVLHDCKKSFFFICHLRNKILPHNVFFLHFTTYYSAMTSNSYVYMNTNILYISCGVYHRDSYCHTTR